MQINTIHLIWFNSVRYFTKMYTHVVEIHSKSVKKQ